VVKRSDALKAVNTAVAGVVAAVATIFALFFVSPMPIHMNYRLFTLLIIGTVVAIWVVAYVFVLLSGTYNRNIYNEPTRLQQTKRVEAAATNPVFFHTYNRAATAENFKSQQKQYTRGP